ncbi:MAG: SUMF1/EgtB/PvdO family nonheme iron enzyme [Spirochaetota bacterium]
MKESRVLPVIICLFLLIFIISAGAEEKRIALVIGNNAYQSSPLRNPLNDARDVSQSLAAVDFEVETLLDASRKEMDDAIYKFGVKLREGGVGLFYYSGHGAQYRGENYLIPVDVTIRSAVELPYKAVPAGLLLGYMNEARNELNMVVLDACRDNPFAGAKSVDKGLTVMGERPEGSIIVYATAPGKTAEDGTGRNSPFTSAFLKYVRRPGIDVKRAFDFIGQEVAQSTQDRQRPAIYHDFYGEFYFAGEGGGEASVVEERAPGPVITIEEAYGSVRVETETAGTFYLDGVRQTSVPAGASARIDNLEAGTHTFRMVYEDGERETKTVTVYKDSTAPVAFSYRPAPKVPEGFVLVEAGTFSLGSNAGASDEKPVHTVTISRPFYMSKYEVTQAQWRAVMGSNPSYFKGDDLPVESVNWYEAVEYCNRLSRQEGLTACYSGSGASIRCDFSADGYRLPTEAEWEYAARGGQESRGYAYSGSNSAGGVGWYWNNSGGKTHPVGQKLPNELGLYDLSGNATGTDA